MLLFISFIVFCICLPEIGTNEISFTVSNLNVLDYKFLKDYDYYSVEEPGFNQTEAVSKALQPADCPCKNGRCVWKGIRKECVCDPEFGKVSDSECRYCDCGSGFNCTFYGRYDRYRMERICSCPEGFTKATYGGSCRAMCNSTHPCQNGGTCDEGRCRCKSGTMGDFCEAIFWCSYECRPRLIVDCAYDQEKENYQCLCKNRSLLFDYKEQVCKPCPCGEGVCKYEYRELHCDCHNGYQEFKGRCKLCDCGSDGSCEINRYTGEKICRCNDGFFAREGKCVACECGLDNVKCNQTHNIKLCDCPKGYEDRHGACEDINECLVNNTCHPTAKCINTPGSFRCECENGYRGAQNRAKQADPGEICEDIDDCEEDSGICHSWENVKCVNLPGTYKCECISGYEPMNMNVDPQKTSCEEYKESWLPAGIAAGTAVFLIIISVGMVRYIDYRNRR
ncbi:uncharacterized protein NPIL_671641 [Nephila pilipes]|uniref:EGF-like domain-containing protein n=1 Tax=Nephila pilipes TaxID=299642 RepID=A0A8X6NU74_NEPPI|nr:uncharacterized protein NPIL_671641 [Nephila pilipes]